jgi:hypothetical protein
MNAYWRKSRSARQSGQDLVEFALVLPLLLLIVVGVLDLGRAFFASIAVANITREGARNGVDIDWDYNCQGGCDYSEVYNAAFGEASNTGLDFTNLTVVANCGNCESDDPLIVTGTYDFELILNLILPDFSIQRSTTMRIP